MGQEIRIERPRRRGAAERAAPAEGEREPQSTDEARRAIEATRGRISETLDAIEDRIDDTRAEIREKVDITRPIRRQLRAHPLRGLGLAFGVGLLLGLSTGGGEEAEEAKGRERARAARRGMLDREEREELRRWRAERRNRLIRRSPMRRRAGIVRSSYGRMRDAAINAAVAGLAGRVRRAMAGGGRPGRS